MASKDGMSMFDGLPEREGKVLEQVVANPRISVTELATLNKVSAVTIRNILQSLEDRGLFIRSHGGGLPAFHPAMLARQASHWTLKLKLAKAASDMIKTGDEVMVIGGTTTSLIVRYLYGRNNIRIVTNSTMLLPYARTNMGLDFIFTGGKFRPEVEEMIGPATLRDLRQYHVATAFLGTDGMMPPDMMLTADTEEISQIAQTMCEQADQVVVVADSSKIGRAGFAQMMPLKRVNTLVIDDGIPPAIAEKIRRLGVKLIIVPAK